LNEVIFLTNEYWKIGIGQEMYYYDSNKELDLLIDRSEKQLQTLIRIGKLTKEEMKWVIGLPDEIFDIIYNRNLP